jgi:hypothetical protein
MLKFSFTGPTNFVRCGAEPARSWAALARRAGLRGHHTMRQTNACSTRLPCLSCVIDADLIGEKMNILLPGILRATLERLTLKLDLVYSNWSSASIRIQQRDPHAIYVTKRAKVSEGIDGIVFVYVGGGGQGLQAAHPSVGESRGRSMRCHHVPRAAAAACQSVRQAVTDGWRGPSTWRALAGSRSTRGGEGRGASLKVRRRRKHNPNAGRQQPTSHALRIRPDPFRSGAAPKERGTQRSTQRNRSRSR